MRPRGWGVVFQGEKAARLGRGDGQRNNEFVSLQKKELHALATYPLHAVALDRSPLVIMAGSHRWEGTQDVRFFNHTDLAELEEKFRDAGKEVRVVLMTLKKDRSAFTTLGPSTAATRRPADCPDFPAPCICRTGRITTARSAPRRAARSTFLTKSSAAPCPTVTPTSATPPCFPPCGRKMRDGTSAPDR